MSVGAATLPPSRGTFADGTQTLGAGPGTFAQELWDENRDVYDAILRHPFLVGLRDGSLDHAAFTFYMMQDAHYLRAFGEALQVLSRKAPRPEWAALLSQQGTESLQEELRLHESVFADYGISRDDAARMEPAPEAFAYTSYLVATAHTRPFAEAMAAVLPCYWIYLEVGTYLQRQRSTSAVYQKWIDNYSSPSYAEAVRAVIAIVNEVARHASAEERRRMREHYRRSCRYEWMFWDSAYHRRAWPPAPIDSR